MVPLLPFSIQEYEVGVSTMCQSTPLIGGNEHTKSCTFNQTLVDYLCERGEMLF